MNCHLLLKLCLAPLLLVSAHGTMPTKGILPLVLRAPVVDAPVQPSLRPMTRRPLEPLDLDGPDAADNAWTINQIAPSVTDTLEPIRRFQVAEGPELFHLVLNDVTSWHALGPQTSTLVTINDDGGPVRVRVSQRL